MLLTFSLSSLRTIVSVAGITVSHAPYFFAASIFSSIILWVTNGRTASWVTITLSSSMAKFSLMNLSAFSSVPFLVEPPSTTFIFSAIASPRYFFTRSFVWAIHALGQRTIMRSIPGLTTNFSIVWTIIGFEPSWRYCLGISALPILLPIPPAKIAPMTI